MFLNQNLGTMKSFLGNLYKIPPYQREYSWEENELQDFWTDLNTLVSQKDKTAGHFLGQVVIHKDEKNGEKFIIDGQQRTTTAMIFLRALQVCYQELLDKDSSLKTINKKLVNISENYLGNYDDEEKNLHLTLSDADNDYYINNVILNNPIEKKVKGKKSNERIRYAYKFLYQCIIEMLEKETKVPKEQKDLLDIYYETFIEQVYIMSVETVKLEDAFIIFETLNARGKGLETSDLLKNHIFQYESKEIETAQKQWNSMSDNLGKVDTTKYIRAYWNSRNDFTRDKALYRTISNHIDSPRKSKELLADLEKYSLYFHDIVSPNECSIIENPKLRKCLQNLQTLKVKTFYPLLLALFEKERSEDEILQVALIIEKYYFRNFTICRKNPNTNETFLSSIAKDIFDENLDTVDEIINKIKDKQYFGTDTEFKSNFEIWTGTSANKEVIQYMFRKMNAYLDKNHELNDDNTQVNIEHIMPEDNSQWPETKEYHEEYKWRLGNLTLLSGKLNKQISNKPFLYKKESYKDSVIVLNKSLLDYDMWNKETIEKRQKELADLALKIW